MEVEGTIVATAWGEEERQLQPHRLTGLAKPPKTALGLASRRVFREVVDGVDIAAGGVFLPPLRLADAGCLQHCLRRFRGGRILAGEAYQAFAEAVLRVGGAAVLLKHADVVRLDLLHGRVSDHGAGGERL